MKLRPFGTNNWKGSDINSLTMLLWDPKDSHSNSKEYASPMKIRVTRPFSINNWETQI